MPSEPRGPVKTFTPQSAALLSPASGSSRAKFQPGTCFEQAAASSSWIASLRRQT